MPKIFILGNGFDIASGLQTEYKDFRKWFMENHDLDYSRLDRIAKEEAFSELEIPEGIVGNHGEVVYDEKNLAAFFYTLVTYANPNDITWNGFEANLSRLPFDAFEDSYFYDGDDAFEKEEIVEQVGDDLSEVFVDVINRYFTDWIRYIHMNKKPMHVKKLILDNMDSTFLTFNYTDVLEELYKIPDAQICHIHGYVKKGENIIIGHGDKVSYDFDFDPFSTYSYIIEAKKELKKPVKEIILKNSPFFQRLGRLKEIYIIGWGLDNSDFVDAPYLQEVINHTDLSTVIYFDSFDLCKQERYIKTCRKNGFNGLFGISDSNSAYKYLI